jgi:glutamate-ammonia-ligase adenylyltransferase
LLGAGNTARDIETGLQECVALGWMDAAQSAALSRSYRLFWHIQLVTKLLSETVIDDAHMPESIGQGGLAFLLRESEFDTLAALRAGIERIGETAAIALESVLPDIKGRHNEIT